MRHKTKNVYHTYKCYMYIEDKRPHSKIQYWPGTIKKLAAEPNMGNPFKCTRQLSLFKDIPLHEHTLQCKLHIYTHHSSSPIPRIWNMVYGVLGTNVNQTYPLHCCSKEISHEHFHHFPLRDNTGTHHTSFYQDPEKVTRCNKCKMKQRGGEGREQRWKKRELREDAIRPPSPFVHFYSCCLLQKSNWTIPTV